jgi:cytochrome c oxidase assembly protein subunit 15
MLSRLSFVAAAMTILLGTVVTAAGPHAGDEQAQRLNIVVRDVARIHSVMVWLFLAVLVLMVRAVWRDGAPRVVRDAARDVLVASIAQGAVGYVQYFTGVPALLVGVHIVGALAVWITVTRLNLLESAVPSTEAVPVTTSAAVSA